MLDTAELEDSVVHERVRRFRVEVVRVLFVFKVLAINFEVDSAQEGPQMGCAPSSRSSIALTGKLMLRNLAVDVREYARAMRLVDNRREIQSPGFIFLLLVLLACLIKSVDQLKHLATDDPVVRIHVNDDRVLWTVVDDGRVSVVQLIPTDLVADKSDLARKLWLFVGL